MLSVEAAGAQDAQVRIGRTGADRSPHVNVRVGTVIVHCLDPAAVMSIAAAWVEAETRIGRWLPDTAPPRTAHPRDVGVSYPAGSVIFEGRQPWSISTVREDLTVTFGCISVAVRDRAALETHTRAWREAADISVKLYPGRATPYGELLRDARISSIQRAADERRRPARARAARERAARER